MLKVTTPAIDTSNPHQSRSKFHYLQAAFIFLVLSLGIRETSFFFSPSNGFAFLALAYLIRYINKPKLPPKAWLILKLITYLALILPLGIIYS